MLRLEFKDRQSQSPFFSEPPKHKNNLFILKCRHADLSCCSSIISKNLDHMLYTVCINLNMHFGKIPVLGEYNIP